jgi:hypothetical protein
MDQVLTEHQDQVTFTEDQKTVQQFAAEGPDDAFADGIHPWRPRQGGDDPQSFGLEHLTERGGKKEITIMNKEPQRADPITQIHGQIPGLLHRPRPGRVRDHPALCSLRVPCSMNTRT